MKKQLFFIIMMPLLLTINKSKAQCHIDDWTALKALYESANGDEWEENEGWEQVKGDEPPLDCDLGKMKGIIIDEFYNTRVEEINLPSNNLVGFIPKEISKLSQLKDLSLVSNRLTGSIPSSISEMEHLVYLGLDFNQLSGTIPPEISNLSNLVWLRLMSNQLTGEIPPELGDLKSIARLVLSDNQLTGEIPVELSKIQNRLFQLKLSQNQLSGSIPPEFGDIPFTGGTALTLHSNNLSGCYDANLLKLCDQFEDAVYGFIDLISGYNNFDATLEEFCKESKGICDTTNRCHPTDWQALQAIYQNYGGDNWLNTNGWDSLIANQDTILTNCNLDMLYGVATNADGRVDSINLSGNELSGNFTADWLNLTELNYLNLADNNFTGCFDSLSIGLCEKLDSPYFKGDSLIDQGNNFEATWDFFCTYETCDTTSTGIFNFNEYQSINLFPNPATNFVYVDIPHNEQQSSYEIFDINGKLITVGMLDIRKRIDVTKLSMGSYFVLLNNEQNTYLSRLLKW